MPGLSISTYSEEGNAEAYSGSGAGSQKRCRQGGPTLEDTEVLGLGAAQPEFVLSIQAWHCPS